MRKRGAGRPVLNKGKGRSTRPVAPEERLADSVNHPTHYTDHPSGVECIQIVEHMTFCAGNAVKYCWRAGQKVQPKKSSAASRIEDLEKARWYLDREIARLSLRDDEPPRAIRQKPKASRSS